MNTASEITKTINTTLTLLTQIEDRGISYSATKPNYMAIPLGNLYVIIQLNTSGETMLILSGSEKHSECETIDVANIGINPTFGNVKNAINAFSIEYDIYFDEGVN